MIRVLIADDQELVREGFRLILEGQEDIEVVGEAVDGRAAVDQARRLRPDVVLMDIVMPRVSGIDATRTLHSDVTPGPPVLVLTTHGEDEHVYDALQAGAAGFLLKDAPRARLLAAVRQVAAGEELLDPSVTRRLIRRFTRQPDPATGAASSPLSVLTQREREVMTLIARGLTNTEIATRLGLGQATVKTHVSRLFHKLHVHHRVQIVIAAYEYGLVQPGQHDPDSAQH
jgi:DNA-binding NarL/FixJ family response regulator